MRSTQFYLIDAHGIKRSAWNYGLIPVRFPAARFGTGVRLIPILPLTLPKKWTAWKEKLDVPNHLRKGVLYFDAAEVKPIFGFLCKKPERSTLYGRL